LVAAIGVMAVAAIISLTVTSSTIYAVGYSTASRAGVEAQAAAEGGIDFAAANLASSCQPTYANAAPAFSVAVYWSSLTQASAPAVDTSWVAGCPTSATAQRLKLVSTGSASVKGLAGNSSGNSRKVEADYNYTFAPSPWLTASGAAIYSYNQSDTTVNNLTLTQAGASLPTIQYLTGSMNCTSGSAIKGNVILGGGAAALASGCVIDGDLYASGTINLQNSSVYGNVSASNPTSYSVDLSNTATVDGGVNAAGPVRIQGTVGGSVVAGPAAGASTISNGATIGGSVVVAGTVSSSGRITGTVTQGATGMVAPTVPYVPRWVDYPYSITDWPGFTELSISGASCSGTGLTTALNTVFTASTPYVLNAVSCTVDLSGLPSTQTLNTDVAIVANAFKLSNNDFESTSVSSNRNLWLIIPDRGVTNNHLPDCPTGGGVTMTNRVDIGAKVAAMIYSPCPVLNSADVWRGQIYANSTKTSNAFTLNYVPIGIPGVNLSDGYNNGEAPPPAPGVLGARTSLRTLSGG
jgi:cytoskeletal protein CcmA (bactofilin family)